MDGGTDEEASMKHVYVAQILFIVQRIAPTVTGGVSRVFYVPWVEYLPVRVSPTPSLKNDLSNDDSTAAGQA